jgi:acetyl esterase/lipase
MNHPNPTGTRHLIAPELVAALDLFPELVLSEEMLPLMRNPPPGARGMMQPPPLTPEQESVACEQRFVPGLDGAPDVRVLVYTPQGTASGRPGYLHIHGGGYILGTPEINDGMNRDLALAHACVIVSVDYRLAPETRWPGPIEDCYAALAWLFEQANALGVDTTRVAIGGESAGGGHAAALALYARNRGDYPISFMLLDSPMLDDRTGSSAEPHPVCGEFVWTPERNRFGWRALLGLEPGSTDVPSAAAPGRAESVAGLPATFICVGALDLFLEESLEFTRRLARAGVPAELHVVPGAYHGFSAFSPAPQVRSVMRLRNEALSRAFANG